MDRTYIESQRIVPRYLSGDLTVREAREFEKYCLEHPDVLNSLPIPVRVKTKMARHPGDELDAADFSSMPSSTAIDAAGLDTDDEEDDDDEPASGRSRGMSSGGGRWTGILGIALLVAIAGVIALFIQQHVLEKEIHSAQVAASQVQLRAPGSMQEYRVRPGASAPGTVVNIGAPNPPQLIELRIDMAEGKFNTFLVTIDSVSAGRVMQIRRVARDSNGEMRIGLNSSAFSAGDYDVKLAGYTWRGDTVPVSYFRLAMK